MAQTRGASDHRTMATYLIEIYMADPGALEVDRAMRMLVAAQSRVAGSMPVTRTIFVGVSRGDGRLICLIETESLVSARRMVGLALLPPARIREITDVVAEELFGGRHPGGDVHPGAEAQLVEDVVDVGLDGALGQE
jgi:hypothetical protein